MNRLAAALGVALALLFAAPAAYADQGSLCMPTSGTVSGLQFAQAVNTALQALVTSNSGASAPVNPCGHAPQVGQSWLNSSTSPPALQLFDVGSNWETLGHTDSGTGIWVPPVGGGLNSISSAATTDLWSVAQSAVTVSGTSTITQLATSAAVAGTVKFVVFSGSLLLTYDATQLILPGGRSYVTAAGDSATVQALGGNNVRVLSIAPASGLAVNTVPTGHIDEFLLAACPATWVAEDGSTIGDASSGAGRANADTFALFSAYWNLSASASPILTSAGAGSTRGGSAAADFAAHKRLTSPDMRAQFLRGLDNGRGVDAGRALGTAQAFATAVAGLAASSSASSSFTGSALPGHSHSSTLLLDSRYGANSNGAFAAYSAGDTIKGTASVTFGTTSVSAGTPAGSVATSVSTSLTGDAETRPANVAVLICGKL